MSPVSPALRCSVVIPTRDRPATLERCLQALARLEPRPYEIIVVDSAPQRLPAESVAHQYGARYLLERGPGASRARNRGAREATGDIVAYLDDDSLPQPCWLAAIAREFSDPRVAVVTGRILAEKVETDAEGLFDAMGGLDCGEAYRKIDTRSPDWFELANFGGFSGGANMALRRSVFSQWDGFDQRLGRGAAQNCNEEPYAYFNLLEREHAVVYTPAALVRHPLPQTMGELRARCLSDMRWSAAYFALLVVEHPRHRSRLLRYGWQALRGAQRDWRPLPTTGRRRIVSRWRTMFEWAKGPLLYARMRWQTREMGAQQRKVAAAAGARK